MAIVWLNGRYLDERRARLPVTDPVFRWGVGLFEVVRGYHGRPFRLEDHLSRLRRSADRLSIDTRRLPGLSRVIPRLLARNELRSGRVRISVTGAGNVLIEARRHAPPDGRIGERGAKLVVAPWRRDPAAPLAGHKTLNYHELVLARDAAARLGAVDALILDPGGRVLEGTRSNVFAVLGGGLLTPDVPRGVLPGVTRKVVLELAQGLRIRTRPARLTLARLLGADEVFVTSTMMEVVPVARIDRQSIGRPGPVTRALSEAYRRCVERECGSPTRAAGRSSRRGGSA